MESSGLRRSIARRVVDELADFSGEREVPKYMKFFFLQQIAGDRSFTNFLRDQAQSSSAQLAHLNILITKMEAMDNRLEVYDSMQCLKESKEAENNKLIGLNDLIALTKENIRLKEGHVEAIEEAINFV
ncbi:hypothetical protein Tco_0370331 [Tanacetum coccineum]